MTREISKKESTEAILDNGAFAALVDDVNKGDISPQDASVFLGAIFACSRSFQAGLGSRSMPAGNV